MKKLVVKNIANIKFEKSVACIGYFDGVHKGHQRLIDKAIEDAKKLGVKSSVICFEPDPINVITNKKNKHILSYKNRLAIFEYLGVDIVYVLKFDETFMNIKPLNFIKAYLNKMNLVELICGFDYSFGYMAQGKPELLMENGNFKTEVLSEYKYAGKKVSSTRIKEALYKGNFKLVNKLLGWQYLIDLKVVNSSKKGKKWLIEAKLSDPNTILPIDGNYNDTIQIKDKRVFILGNYKLDKGIHLFMTFDE